LGLAGWEDQIKSNGNANYHAAKSSDLRDLVSDIMKFHHALYPFKVLSVHHKINASLMYHFGSTGKTVNRVITGVKMSRVNP